MFVALAAAFAIGGSYAVKVFTFILQILSFVLGFVFYAAQCVGKVLGGLKPSILLQALAFQLIWNYTAHTSDFDITPLTYLQSLVISVGFFIAGAMFYDGFKTESQSDVGRCGPAKAEDPQGPADHDCK